MGAQRSVARWVVLYHLPFSADIGGNGAPAFEPPGAHVGVIGRARIDPAAAGEVLEQHVVVAVVVDVGHALYTPVAGDGGRYHRPMVEHAVLHVGEIGRAGIDPAAARLVL